MFILLVFDLLIMFKHFYTKIYKKKIKFNPLFLNSVSLISKETLLVSEVQINALKKYIKKYFKKKYKIHFCLNLKMPVTSKPIGARMGKGKGEIKGYTYNINRGEPIFEITGEDLNLILNVLEKSQNKLNFNTNIIINDL